MKVLVVNNAAPFVRGGAEALADHLTAALNATPGVQAELMRLPFSWSPSERLLDEILIHQGLRIHNVDRVIGLKFPAYLVPHPDRALWLLHQFRQAYDLGDVGQGLGDEGRDGEIKQAIRRADNQAFADTRQIFVNSPVTQDRLKRYNGVDSALLYPPLNDPALFGAGGPGADGQGDYIFAGGRVAAGKRQHLLVEAMARVSGGRLVIAGPVEDPAYGDRLTQRVAELGLEDRVSLRIGFHPRQLVAEWVNGSLACAYLPYDEDSLGYVTMEAFAAGKAVLTTSDSGGLLEIVSTETGYVCDPDPAALAGGLDFLISQPARSRRLGQAAGAVWRARGLTWEATIATLLSR